jgi:hypothetical protein
MIAIIHHRIAHLVHGLGATLAQLTVSGSVPAMVEFTARPGHKMGHDQSTRPIQQVVVGPLV